MSAAANVFAPPPSSPYTIRELTSLSIAFATRDPLYSFQTLAFNFRIAGKVVG
jgi:hypothetical protein